jgi:hypothetical protein
MGIDRCHDGPSAIELDQLEPRCRLARIQIDGLSQRHLGRSRAVTLQLDQAAH